ncbi:restriction endonuclease [Sinorhizobium meliloti]|uniref:restriction endonuclease n=1 Tax=Rhizobium meliloti TaxID=382 RepID=UPI00398CA4E3
MADVAERIADELGLKQDERDELLPSGRQRLLHNRIHWAKFYMSKAGLIASPARGRFVATEKGRALLATSPERIDVALLMQEPEFRESTETSVVQPKRVAAQPSLSMPLLPGRHQKSRLTPPMRHCRQSCAMNCFNVSSATVLPSLSSSLSISGLWRQHKDAAAQLGRSGDGGVDGIVNEDRLGLDRIYVQAKRYAPGNLVGRPDVNGFVGSLVGLGATKGVFVTTSTFSQPARDYVKHLAQRVILIDGQELTDLRIEHGVGVRSYRTVEFKRLDGDFFGEE